MAHTDTAGLQQYALLSADLSAQVPSNLTDDQAATIPVNALAPFIALFHQTGLNFPPPGSKEGANFGFAEKTLLIVGGGANCGKFGIQFAKMVGFGKIVVIAGKGGEEELKGYGATHVVDRRLSNEEIKKAVMEIVGGNKVKYVYDALNFDHTLAVSLLSDEEKGVVAVLLPTKVLDEEKIGRKEKGYEVMRVFGASHAQPEFFAELFWKNMPGWIERHEVKPLGFKVVEGGLNADAVNEVLNDYRDGKNPGKWHVHPNE
jgi:NADPH2:quinone reductase